MVAYDYLKILKTARYYYEEKLTQQEISRKMNLSRPTISNFLKEAKKMGIVQINVVDIKNQQHILDMEENLIKYFNLKDVKIFEYNKNDDLDLKKKLGRVAADYFENNILKSNIKIGIAWGYTLNYMVNNLKKDNSIEGLEVVSILGGSGNLKSEVNANNLCRRIVNKYNGEDYFLYAPVIANNKDARETIKLNYDIKEILEKGKYVDVVLAGIGKPIGISLLLETGYFKENEIQELKDHNAIGDICASFFDEKGNLCDTEINEKVVGLNIKDLKNIETVIGIAGGDEKVKSILGSLRGGFINTLITDSITAEKIIDIEQKSRNN